jgi:hypothetical protein
MQMHHYFLLGLFYHADLEKGFPSLVVVPEPDR